MGKLFGLVVIFFLLSMEAGFSQKLYFAEENYRDSNVLSKNIPFLARMVIEQYKETDQSLYLDQLFRLQLVANQYEASNKSLKKLGFYILGDSVSPTALGFVFKIYNATMLSQNSSIDFENEYEKIFLSNYSLLTEDGKNWASGYFENDLYQIKINLDSKLKELSNSDSVSIEDAVKLCRNYASYMSFQRTQKLAKKILIKLEGDKFIRDDSVLVKMPDGGIISLTIVRNKIITTPQPVILMYNIYAGQDALRCKDAAVRGYTGIVANTRGKRLSPDAIEPFEHDAKDAYYIIDWISKQPWCNGKVGMYGGSYLGFSQWSAVKYLHPALKTIVPQVAVGAGIDFPMQNGIYKTYMLRWLHYVMDNKLTNQIGFSDEKKWNDLFGKWYQQGKSFRSLDTMEGRPNYIFQRWLKHPGYDDYWKNMTPQNYEFSKISIPIFTTTGYWDDDQLGAMNYYKQYQQWNKNNNYYLLIGPYDHAGSQGFPEASLNGYQIDSIANIPILDIVFKWFDYTLKDSSRPAILKDKVNFEVMGKNEWKHVPTLDNMHNDSLRFYLSNSIIPGGYSLGSLKPTRLEYISQIVDFKDRADVRLMSGDISMFSFLVDSVLHPQKEQLVFISKPVNAPFAISGAIKANIVTSVNKKDMDILMELYELTPDGKYFALSSNIQRASYAKDRSNRHLLKPDKMETINLNHTFITCKQLQKGSRVVLLLGINKNPDWQINYGTGKDVSDETMKDAGAPMHIKWYNSSCITLEILR